MLAASNRSHKWQARKIVFMMVLTSLLAIVVLFGTTLWLTNAANRMAAKQSKDQIVSELLAVSSGLSTIVHHTGHWDTAYEWVTQGQREAVITNIGSGASTRGPFHMLYIVNSVGTPLYAFEYEETEIKTIYAHPELVNVVRAEMRDLPMEPYQTISGYIAVRDRIAMATAGRIQPIDSSNISTEVSPILIGMRWFGQEDIDQIADRLQLDGLRLDYWDTEPRDGTMSVPLLDIAGRAIAHVSWFPPQPGDELLSQILPMIGIMSCIMFGASLGVGRAATGQNNALVREMHVARTDRLTGKLNRAGLDQLVASPQFQTALSAGTLAVIYVDVNDFKILNDSSGHDVGDAALKSVAAWMTQCCRGSDWVARLGGDEFACVLMDVSSLDIVETVAKRIAAYEPPADITDPAYPALSLSLGIAMARAGEDWNSVLTRADQGMYEDKRRHKASRGAADA